MRLASSKAFGWRELKRRRDSRVRRPAAGSPRQSDRGCGRHSSTTTPPSIEHGAPVRREVVHSLRRVIKRGARLKARLGVNGSQNASRSLVWRVARLPISVIGRLAILGRQPKATTRFPQPCKIEHAPGRAQYNLSQVGAASNSFLGPLIPGSSWKPHGPKPRAADWQRLRADDGPWSFTWREREEEETSSIRE